MRKIDVTKTKTGDVRYRVRFRLNGMQSSRTFGTEAEAVELRQLMYDMGTAASALLYLDRRDGILADNRLTLNKWFAMYKETRSGVEERTLSDYQRTYDRHIKPTLGGWPISSIDKAAVAGLINKLAKEGKVNKDGKKSGLSAKTIANIHGILASALNEAVIQRKLDTNPCQGIRLPRAGEVDREDERFLTHEEYNRLEDALAEDWPHWVPLVRTLVGTGMRWAEVTALRVGEVNLITPLPTIKIIRATKWASGRGHYDGIPKTKKSRRTIIMPPQVAEVIAPLLVGKSRDDHVFLATRGGPVRHSGFHRLVWTKACAKAGLDPAPRIHDMRHSFASWMIEMGIGLEAIQDQLGHESILTTRKVYGHLQPAMREALAHAAEKALDMGRKELPATM